MFIVIVKIWLETAGQLNFCDLQLQLLKIVFNLDAVQIVVPRHQE